MEDRCPAPFDEFGLLCKQCGLCSIRDVQLEAERLGYAVLVAEGSAIVMSLIQTGKIEAIVGVSCLSVLERAFPYMEAAAIPGVAVPLLQDDCIDTNVDIDWVWEYIHLTSDDRTRRLDLGALPAIYGVVGILYMLGGLLFGIATLRAGILPRRPAGLLAVVALVTPAASLLPHEYQRLAGMPVGLALAWLGFALWSERHEPASAPLPEAAAPRLSQLGAD